MLNPLPKAESAQLILSFDFDGTLHHPMIADDVPRVFFDQIKALRENRNAVWGINTGRSLPHLVAGMKESNFPFLPDWIVTQEREIYFPNDKGAWIPEEVWNRKGNSIHAIMFQEYDAFFNQARKEVNHRTSAQWVEMESDPAGIISSTEEEMEQIVTNILLPLKQELAPELSWQRNSIYLRFSHRAFHKGSSLSEIAMLMNLDASNCFAMGDSHNDLDMLNPLHASYLACPNNAVDEVKAQVAMYQGYQSPLSYGKGVVDALNFYFN